MGCSGNSSSHFLASSPVSRTERSPAGCGSLWAGALARLVGELANVWLVCLAPALPGQARLMMMMIVVAVAVPVRVPVAVLLQPSLSLTPSIPRRPLATGGPSPPLPPLRWPPIWHSNAAPSCNRRQVAATTAGPEALAPAWRRPASGGIIIDGGHLSWPILAPKAGAPLEARPARTTMEPFPRLNLPGREAPLAGW